MSVTEEIKKKRGRKPLSPEAKAARGIIGKGLKALLPDAESASEKKTEINTPFREWLYTKLSVKQWLQFEAHMKSELETAHKFNRLLNNIDSWDGKALKAAYAWLVYHGYEKLQTYVLDWARSMDINFGQLLLTEADELMAWYNKELEGQSK